MMKQFTSNANNRTDHSKTLAGLLLLLCAGLLYVSTLDNGLLPRELEGGDLITHQYAQVQARPSNAPGYPIYTMGGWLWFHSIHSVLRAVGSSLPNPIPILSSYSTLWALLSLWLFYQILCHITQSKSWPSGNWVIAWLLGAFYAVTYFFWFYATTTEQYSSAIAHTLAIVFIYLKWDDAETERQGDKKTKSTICLQSSRLLVSLSFLCGLSLAHMLTVAFIVPPLVLLVLWNAPWLLRRPLIVLGAVGAAALPLLSYIYVYVRGAAHPEWWGKGDWATGQEWFWSFVRTSQGWEELGWGLESERAFWGGGFPELMWQELTIPLFVFGLIGIALLGRRLAVLLYGTIAIYLLFCWAYRYGNWFQVILPAYPLMLMGVAIIADRWWRWKPAATESTSPVSHHWPKVALVFALGLLIIGRGIASLPEADSHNRPNDSALDAAMVLLDAPLPQNAALFGVVDETLAIQYLTQIWGLRPDLSTVASPQAADLLGSGEAVYATAQSAARLYSEMPNEFDITVSMVNPDWTLFSTQGEMGVGDYREPTVILDGENVLGVTLAGYTAEARADTLLQKGLSTTSLDVMLYWALSEDGWPDGLSISVRPLHDEALIPEPAGELGAIVQQDAAQPMHGLLPLRGPLLNGALLADAYRVDVPVESTDGVDEIQILLYRGVEGGFETVAEYRLVVLPW